MIARRGMPRNLGYPFVVTKGLIMGTVRKLAAVLACTALLSVVGVTTAGAQAPAACDRVAKVTERLEAKQARVAARNANRARTANEVDRHKQDLAAKLQAKVAKLQARCAD